MEQETKKKSKVKIIIPIMVVIAIVVIVIVSVAIAISKSEDRRSNSSSKNKNSNKTVLNESKNFMKDENIINNESETKKEKIEFNQVNYGDTISNDFVEMTIETSSVADALYPDDISEGYSYIPLDNENEKYFYLTGNIKNISGKMYDIENIYIQMIFDDKYTYTGHLEATDGDDFFANEVKPLSTVKYYIYSSIPDELIESYSNCKIQFAFNNNFEDDYKTDFKKYNNRYEITISKQKETTDNNTTSTETTSISASSVNWNEHIKILDTADKSAISGISLLTFNVEVDNISEEDLTGKITNVYINDSPIASNFILDSTYTVFSKQKSNVKYPASSQALSSSGEKDVNKIGLEVQLTDNSGTEIYKDTLWLNLK